MCSCFHVNLFFVAGARLLGCGGDKTYTHIRSHLSGKHSCIYVNTEFCKQAWHLLLAGGTAARFGCAAHSNARSAAIRKNKPRSAIILVEIACTLANRFVQKTKCTASLLQSARAMSKRLAQGSGRRWLQALACNCAASAGCAVVCALSKASLMYIHALACSSELNAQHRHHHHHHVASQP